MMSNKTLVNYLNLEKIILDNKINSHFILTRLTLIILIKNIIFVLINIFNLLSTHKMKVYSFIARL